MSDVHLELRKSIPDVFPKVNKGNILALAGDIGNPKQDIYLQFLKECKERYEHVLLVPGNREYYNDPKSKNHILNIKDINNILDELCDKSGCTFLNNNKVYIENVPFYGTTFWSSISKDSHERVRNEHGMFDMIHTEHGFLTPHQLNELNRKSKEWLIDELNNEHRRGIVITHHPPTIKKIKTHFLDSNTDLYHSPSEDVLNPYKISAWISGHTHDDKEFSMNGVSILSNPLGSMEEASYELLFRRNKAHVHFR